MELAEIDLPFHTKKKFCTFSAQEDNGEAMLMPHHLLSLLSLGAARKAEWAQTQTGSQFCGPSQKQGGLGTAAANCGFQTLI